jgi:hypothetical protein
MLKDPEYNPAFVLIKLMDIGLVTLYFFAFGLIFAKLFDAVYGSFERDAYEKRSTFALFGEIVIHVFLIGVVAYVMRNVVEMIPSPVDGIAGFQHSRLKELEGGHILIVVTILFQKNLQEKVLLLGERFGIKS